MSNKDLIPVRQGQINDKTSLVVDARTLHNFLEVKKVFGAWINERIQQYGFQENIDYEITENLIFPNLERSKARTRKLKEYTLTLDMAKELAMVERTPKGREARRYFIRCEQELLKLTRPVEPEAPKPAPIVEPDWVPQVEFTANPGERYESPGINVHALRNLYGWTQRSFSLMTGLSVADIKRIETNKCKFPPELLSLLGRALNVPARSLYDPPYLIAVNRKQLKDRRPKFSPGAMARANPVADTLPLERLDLDRFRALRAISVDLAEDYLREIGLSAAHRSILLAAPALQGGGL